VSGGEAALFGHLKTGTTTVCRCWKITRRDGVVFGFTDHDRDLNFDGCLFRAGTGLDAAAVQSVTGLAVDNSTALGALSDAGVRDADIRAGRFDEAEVLAWQVNWADPDQRRMLFRGTLGEIRRSGAVFEAELRGLSERLNQPVGRIYHRKCSASLGDKACGVDLGTPGYAFEGEVKAVEGRGAFSVDGLEDFEPGWFSHGRAIVLSGANTGLDAPIRLDRIDGGERWVRLWRELPDGLEPGDRIRLEAGCDRSADTCRLKFLNLLNFRGFPFIPGDDWAMAYPVSSGQNDGGSLAR
jgi:uncharacterized phage protein (TIGR02218 family)